jgi:hypothetical protein
LSFYLLSQSQSPPPSTHIMQNHFNMLFVCNMYIVF